MSTNTLAKTAAARRRAANPYSLGSALKNGGPIVWLSCLIMGFGNIVAGQFIKGLLEHMDSKAVPQCRKVDGNTYKVDLVGEDLGYLIGRRGDTLDAIQHLANYTVNRDVEGHIRINVDAECYREKREDSLRRYARKKAQQVLKARRRTTLEPMNAYERHVIHAALQDMENITTHSTGVEPNRRVVIEYVR